MATAAWTAGAMVGDARDIARWAEALFGGRVLKPDSLREMQTLVRYTDYGLGIGRGASPSGDEMWGHGGEIGGYRAGMWHIPEFGVTLVTLWNDGTMRDDLIAQALFQVIVQYLPAGRAGRE